MLAYRKSDVLDLSAGGELSLEGENGAIRVEVVHALVAALVDAHTIAIYRQLAHIAVRACLAAVTRHSRAATCGAAHPCARRDDGRRR